MSSVSSYSSSSESLFERAGTPSSVVSSTRSLVDSKFALPSTFFHLPSSKPSTSALTKVFDVHCTDNRLALVLPTTSDDACPPAVASLSWNKLDASEASESCATTGVDLSDCDSTSPTTDAGVAHHLVSFSLAGLRSILSYNLTSTHALYILERPSFVFPPLSHTPGFSVARKTDKNGNIPTHEEWKRLWSAWDLVTLQMIPEAMLHQKPIDLRHKCLFYIGHIPTFLDMLLSKSIGGGASEPAYFWNIFERGIDPHVDDPDHCHNHSDVPEKDEDWPTLTTIMAFRSRVRARLAQLYDDLQSGKRVLTRNIARTLVMTLEHEGWHIETLLYMLIQRGGSGTLPPPGFTTPPWEQLAQQWNSTPAPSTSTVTLGPATLTLGENDCEGDDFTEGISEDVDGHVFGWDNESPQRCVEVGKFKAEWRPVSNMEYETFWRGRGEQASEMPVSWVLEDGEIKVRTLYGPISIEYAQHWPVLCSYDQLLAYAQSKGGRLPTEAELRLFLDTYEVGYEGGANTGFRNWHPVPATMGDSTNGGKGSNGGVWEWTSTKFDTHDGLSPTNLFTGYSTDFFDTKHHVVLGSSYATIPRLSSRRTVRNFWQHNYPYAWVGGRVVYDI